MPCVAWFKPSSIYIECYMCTAYTTYHIRNFEWMALFFVVVVDFLHFLLRKTFQSIRICTYNAFPLVSLCCVCCMLYAGYRRRHLHFPTVFPRHSPPLSFVVFCCCRFRQNKQTEWRRHRSSIEHAFACYVAFCRIS